MWLDTVPERVAALRQKAGIGQREAARWSGLKSPSHVGMIENGGGSITPSTAVRLCALFGVSVELLLYGKGRPPSVEALKRAVRRAEAAYEQANPAPEPARGAQ